MAVSRLWRLGVFKSRQRTLCCRGKMRIATREKCAACIDAHRELVFHLVPREVEVILIIKS